MSARRLIAAVAIAFLAGFYLAAWGYENGTVTPDYVEDAVEAVSGGDGGEA